MNSGAMGINRSHVLRAIPKALRSGYLPELDGFYRGKSADVHSLPDNKLMIVRTDRVSAFDVVLPELIPFKGQALTELTAAQFLATSSAMENTLVSRPDPNVLVMQKAEPLDVEFIFRRHITGSLWRDYSEKGNRGESYGIRLPDGLKEGHIFENPIYTPTTKAKVGHDEAITFDRAAELCGQTKEEHNDLVERLTRVFERGEQMAERAGMILVDTKYEVGRHDGTLKLIDEIHDMDSSRFWDKSDYHDWQAGQKKGITERSKEIVRKFLREEKGYKGQAGVPVPHLSEDVVVETALTYMEVCEDMTSESFKIDLRGRSVAERIVENLREAGYITGVFVPIIMGSTSDAEHGKKIQESLKNYGILSEMRVASAHKNKVLLGKVNAQYSESMELVVLVTVAGMSDALSGAEAGESLYPVIACPPKPSSYDAMFDYWSSIRAPSAVPHMFIANPSNVGPAVAKIASLSDYKMREKVRAEIESMQDKMAADDAKMRESSGPRDRQ